MTQQTVFDLITTVRLCISKLLGKLVVKYVITYKKYTLKTRSANCYLMVFMQCFFRPIFFIKAYVLGTHLNCIDKSMQYKWVPTT